jgi:hypothetical protein
MLQFAAEIRPRHITSRAKRQRIGHHQRKSS